ncbi:MAG: hypothetical protein NC094_10255 [Bacteroidales bacterium]|nr:hypothetical protein [Lachnoclostridium sp.]MCM1384862.1 hypothetical protein [Lachnoclostridium sp.]MCM1465789.1 hypothetical protein [Bacteroidales bacterium]
MTCKTQNDKPDSARSGGIMDLEDFRKEGQKYKHMTLEELRKLKVISNTDGRPAANLTDEKWQLAFKIRKLFVTPHNKNIKKLKGQNATESGRWNQETQGSYHGQTNWQEYCAYINDVLKNIRNGQIDYCYYVYQIIDLLKFHFDDLRTKYCDGYWEVWLEK